MKLVTRLITECLRSTPVPKLYIMSGTAPHHMKKEVHTKNERTKQIMNERHSMNGQVEPHKRLKSRGSFLRACEPLTKRPVYKRLEKWKEESINPGVI